jgi:cation transport ATPase
MMSASVEKMSEHPLAGAVVREAESRGLTLEKVSGFEALPGSGVRAELEEGILTGGSLKYISEKLTVSDSARRSSMNALCSATSSNPRQRAMLVSMICKSDVKYLMLPS